LVPLKVKAPLLVFASKVGELVKVPLLPRPLKSFQEDPEPEYDITFAASTYKTMPSVTTEG
jgi:hypothetical protein